MSANTEPHSSVPSGALEHLTATHRAVTDPEVCASAAVDWTGHWVGSTPAVFRPRSTAEVSALLADATEAGVGLQIQGGNTSLTGGATPYGEPVLSTSALDRLDVDVEAGRATVGAGVTAGALGAALAGTGWELGVDLASRDSATIGGMISTNTGGLRVLRWGQMASQVLGVEAVLGDGTVLSHLDPPDRDNTGPRWHQLLVGAEGTLGVVCAATLRLVRAEASCTALVGFATVDDAVRAALGARRHLAALRSVELMLAEGVEIVAGHLGVAPPIDGRLHAAYLLIDAAGSDLEAFAGSVAAAVEHCDVTASAFSDGTGRAALWQWRERHTEAIATIGVARKCDVSAPPANIAALVHGAADVVAEAAPGATVVRFGHVAEGNVHVNILNGNDDAEAAVLALAAHLGGSISAEHGIGRQKRRLLGLSRTSAEIAAHERIRAVFDPARVCNPDILIPR